MFCWDCRQGRAQTPISPEFVCFARFLEKYLKKEGRTFFVQLGERLETVSVAVLVDGRPRQLLRHETQH